MKFLKLRISDSKTRNLIKRFLKAGTMEKGNFKETTEGVPQGGRSSPLLEKIYLHYTLDLWFTKVIKKRFNDDIISIILKLLKIKWP